MLHFYRPQMKLRKGNVFTPVCQSFMGGRHAWQGVCMAGGHAGWGGVRGRGHAWQRACMAGGMRDGGHCMAGGGGGRCAWQERRPLQRTVRILLECFLISVMFFSDRDFIFDCKTVFDHMRRKSKTVPR